MIDQSLPYNLRTVRKPRIAFLAVEESSMASLGTENPWR